MDQKIKSEEIKSLNANDNENTKHVYGMQQSSSKKEVHSDMAFTPETRKFSNDNQTYHLKN